MKAFSKQVQAEKEKQRTKAKKDHISDITKLRKQRESSGFAGNNGLILAIVVVGMHQYLAAISFLLGLSAPVCMLLVWKFMTPSMIVCANYTVRVM